MKSSLASSSETASDFRSLDELQWQTALIQLLKTQAPDEESASAVSAGTGKNLKARFNKEHFLQITEKALSSLAPRELGEFFVSAAFLASAMRPLRDQHWLQTRSNPEHGQNQSQFLEFVATVLKRELSPLSYLTPILTDLLNEPNENTLTLLEKKASLMTESAALVARSYETTSDFHSFNQTALKEMQSLVRLESKMLSAQKANLEMTYLGNSLYRAFDLLDRVLGLDYELDDGMTLVSEERIFPGTGRGVQSSYSSILIALEQINPPPDSRFIDLGSGYGRIGFVLGFLRPDIEFIGYEFVDHRVQAGVRAALKAGISSHVKFITQDLSDRNFRIPAAEVYYMYDPFNQDTYQYVTQQLIEIGQKMSARQQLTIATKGRANEWFQKAFSSDHWSIDTAQDEGTMVLFRSNQTESR